MKVERVLVHRPGSLGDTVVALPCFHLVRRLYPEAEVRVLTNAPVAERAPPLLSVLGRSGLVDGCFEYPVATRDLGRLRVLAQDIRRWKPDLGIYLVPRRRRSEVFRDAVFLKICGVNRIVGLPWTHDLRFPRRGPGGLREREAERLARCLASFAPIDVRDTANWNLRLTDEELAASRKAISARIGDARYIALSTGTKQAANEWGAENWQALVRGLLAAFPSHVVLLGSNEDRGLAERLAKECPDRCINLCGVFPVRLSAAAIAHAQLFIGADSGPMHLAAAVGTPLVGIFSTLHPPGIWFPLGERARILYPFENGETIESIHPSAVVSAAEELSNQDRP